MNDPCTLAEVFAREETERQCAEQTSRERDALAAWLAKSEATAQRNVDGTAQTVRV